MKLLIPPFLRNSVCALFIGLVISLTGANIQSAPPRVLPEGQQHQDQRLDAPRTLHDYFPFTQVSSTGEWELRQEQIKRRILISAGLWPMPEKTALNAVVHGKKEMGDYTVEKVFFESLPGHFVTGNLYRPAGDSLKNGLQNGKRPGALCPHGHWENARFYDLGEAQRKQLIAIGGERFESGAQNHYQARCVQLARMGLAVFQYDMIGHSDSKQFQEHRREPRAKMNNPELGKWGFVSPQAEARLQTNFGLQTWNSVRAMDFLLEQDQVDAKRILVTGASGGGTQTMMIAAIDERINKMLDAGIAVMSADLFRQGEFLKAGENASENPHVQYPGKTDKPDQRWRLSGVYNYGYNDSLFSRRVHDILTCLAFVKNHKKWQVKSVGLVGLQGAGAWVAAGSAVAGSAVDRCVVVSEGFRFADLDSSFDQNFLPGIVKYGDIAAFLTQSTAQKLWLFDSDKKLQAQVKSSRSAAGKTDGTLVIYQGEQAQAQQSWLSFLLK
ncbi:MAG: acetylxylan esterase [Verrucomicrobiales bacterium]|nr:acetylxylan esterase [Verrucomicrobiales bacterium]